MVGTPLCPVGRVFCSEPCIGPLQLNRSTRAIGTLYHMSFLPQLTVTELIPFHCSSNEHSTHNEKERTKRKLKRPQHLHSLLSRFSLQPPFIEVLSGLLRAAYWPLVFLFSSFSGLFWPGPFFPIFRQWIPKRCKGVHCVDLGESFPKSIYLQKSASIQPRTSPSKFTYVSQNLLHVLHVTLHVIHVTKIYM